MSSFLLCGVFEVDGPADRLIHVVAAQVEIESTV